MPPKPNMARPSDENAQEVAVSILTWLTEQPELMSRFLALSGLEAGSIRKASSEPGFLGGLTEFIMNHEPTLLAFCADSGIKVEYVAACHYRLNPAQEGWE